MEDGAMPQNIRDLTHAVRQDFPQTAKEGLLRLSFLTASSGFPGKYFQGFSSHRSFSEEDLVEKLREGALLIISPTQIRSDEGVWMDDDGKIFIADKDDPYFVEGNKREVKKMKNMYLIFKNGPNFKIPTAEEATKRIEKLIKGRNLPNSANTFHPGVLEKKEKKVCDCGNYRPKSTFGVMDFDCKNCGGTENKFVAK